jgi:hypothetical protein
VTDAPEQDESFDDVHLPFSQRLTRWLEVRMGYEFLCHNCNSATRHGVAPGRSGCLGQCKLTNKERAEEYRKGSDAYTPRIKNRFAIGGGAMD